MYNVKCRMYRWIVAAFKCFYILHFTFYIAQADDVPRPHDIPPVEMERLDETLLRGIDFLIKNQRKDGSFGSPLNTKKLNIYAPGTSHDAYRTGTTALCLEAMLRVERGRRLSPKVAGRSVSPKLTEDGRSVSPKLTATLGESHLPETDLPDAITRCEAWLLENLPNLRRSAPDTLYNVWGHAYGIQALCLMYDRELPGLSEEELAARKERILEVIRGQVELLGRYECLNGGWCYYNFGMTTHVNTGSPLCFVTGTVLVALAEARARGVEIPERLARRGVASILRQRRPSGAYCYGEYLIKDVRDINHPAGSLSRTLVCNLAVSLWDDESRITRQLLADGLDRFVARIGWNDLGRKRPVPHESWFQIAGYFYYYGHYYAAGCVEKLEDAAERKRISNHLADILLGLQEPDGSWWDYPLYDYHSYYGTAMAVIVLVKCREELTEPQS